MGDFTGTLISSLDAGAELRGIDADMLRDIADALTSGWSTWVPTLTNITQGSGTVLARYRRLNKTVDWRWRFVYGAGSAVGTDPSFTLPTAPSSDYPTGGEGFFPAVVRLVDTGTTTRQGDVTFTSGSTLRLVFWNATPAIAQITSTAPWTWASGDSMAAWGTYYTD